MRLRLGGWNGSTQEQTGQKEPSLGCVNIVSLLHLRQERFTQHNLHRLHIFDMFVCVRMICQRRRWRRGVQVHRITYLAQKGAKLDIGDAQHSQNTCYLCSFRVTSHGRPRNGNPILALDPSNAPERSLSLPKLACGDNDPDGLGEGRGGVAGVRPRVGGLRARDDKRSDDVVDPPVDDDGPDTVAVVGDDLQCNGKRFNLGEGTPATRLPSSGESSLSPFRCNSKRCVCRPWIGRRCE